MSFELSTPDTPITSGKQLAEVAYELTDEEVQKTFTTVMEISEKYKYRRATPEVLTELEDEVKTRLHAIGILATVNAMPVLDGQPPFVDIIGKVSDDGLHQHGFDHERKGWEINKANERKEDYLGQKESINKRRDK